MGLSRFERELVVALQHDPRAPYATLADGLGVDERSVRRAMRRLRDDGVLTCSATIAREDTHGWLAAQLGIGCRAGMVDTVAHALADRSDTRYVAAATGDADLVVVARVLRAPFECPLEDFLTGPLAEIGGLLGCDIRVVLHAYKRNGALVPTTGKAAPD